MPPATASIMEVEGSGTAVTVIREHAAALRVKFSSRMFKPPARWSATARAPWSLTKLCPTQLAQLPQDFIENVPRPVLAAPTTNVVHVDVCWPLHKQHIAGIVDIFRTAPTDFF